MKTLNVVRRVGSVLGCLAAFVYAGGAVAAEPDATISPWLGQEITVDRSSFQDHLPVGGKVTLVYDRDQDLVRLCTRSVPEARAEWREDLALPCNVTMSFVKAKRFCTENEVKAGNAETLAECHRLRSSGIAMHPSNVNGAVELHEIILFPLERVASNSRIQLAVLLESPARTTHPGHGIIH